MSIRKKESVAEACDAYAARSWLSSSTARRIGLLFNRHIKPDVGEVALNSLNVAHALMLASKLTEQGSSPAVTYQVLMYFAAIISYAETRGMMVLPGTASELHKIARRYRTTYLNQRPIFWRKIPTDAEIRQIVEWDNTMRPVLARSAAFGALWPSELCLLTWDDVDFAAGCIHIRGASVRRSRRRSVPLPPRLAQALQEWKAVAPADETNLVFARPTGGAFTPEGLSAWFRRSERAFRTRTGSNASYSLFSLRRFFINWWSRGAVGTRAQLSRLLGRSIPQDEMHGIMKFGHQPIDLERYAAAERAVFFAVDS